MFLPCEIVIELRNRNMICGSHTNKANIHINAIGGFPVEDMAFTHKTNKVTVENLKKLLDSKKTPLISIKDWRVASITETSKYQPFIVESIEQDDDFVELKLKSPFTGKKYKFTVVPDEHYGNGTAFENFDFITANDAFNPTNFRISIDLIQSLKTWLTEDEIDKIYSDEINEIKKYVNRQDGYSEYEFGGNIDGDIYGYGISEITSDKLQGKHDDTRRIDDVMNANPRSYIAVDFSKNRRDDYQSPMSFFSQLNESDGKNNAALLVKADENGDIFHVEKYYDKWDLYGEEGYSDDEVEQKGDKIIPLNKEDAMLILQIQARMNIVARKVDKRLWKKTA